MQAMNGLGLNPTTPAATSTTPAMPFMAAQSDASNKQVSFNDSLAQQISQQVTDPLLESIHLLTQKFDSCAVSMIDSRKGNDRSRNRDRSNDRGRNRSSSRSRNRYY